MLKRLKTHHLFRLVHPLPLTPPPPHPPFTPITIPCGKSHRKREALEQRLLVVEIIDSGKLRFSSEVSLTPGPEWRA